MTMHNRYDVLRDKHRKIEARLAAEMKRPLPDSLVLQRLKRQKLLVRDEIQSWELLMGAVRVRRSVPPGALPVQAWVGYAELPAR